MDASTCGYDSLNRLLTATNYAGTVSFSYDNRGRIQSTTDVFSKTISYGYVETSNTNQKTVTFEGALYETYDFDNANRLTSITDNANGVYSFAYDVVNRMTTRVMPNGVSTTTDYDGMGRMKFWKNQTSSGGILNEYNFGYNTANQIISITEPNRTRTFGYDNSDRLTSVTSTLPNQNENYPFDDVGNRTSSHLSSTYGYQQGAFNRLTATQQASYTFDSNGNVTSKSEGTSKWYYSYDRENRLTNATKFGGMIPRAGENIVYQYDALGRRVVRQDKKTGRTEFTHDGLDIIQDRKLYGDTTTTTNYVNGLGIDDKLKITSGSTSRYFLTDHLGSTVGLADSNGSVTESASYDSFGRVITSNLTTRYQYTGREQDETTGLMYYRARFYDSQIGRFTSEDPIGLSGGINLYGYVDNNPLAFSDPFGLTGEAELRADRNLYRRDSKFAPPPQPMPSPMPIPAPAPTPAPRKQECLCDRSGAAALKIAQQVVAQYPGARIELDSNRSNQIFFPDNFDTTSRKLTDLGYYSGPLAFNPFQHAGGKEFRTSGSPGFHFTVGYQQVEYVRTKDGGVVYPPLPQPARTIDFHIDCNNPVGQGWGGTISHFFDFLGQWF